MAVTSRPLVPTWSITARLIVLFTISTSALVLLVVAIMYYAIVEHLEEEHEHLLSEIVRVLRQTTLSERGVTALVDDVTRIATEDPASYSDPYSLRVLDERRHVLAQSHGMAAVPIAAFDAIPAQKGRRFRPHKWISPSGETFLLTTLDGSRGAGSRSVVQVALNVTRDRMLMRELRNTAVALLAFALIGAAVAGAAVVRHSLRPLQQIAAEVADISAEKLEQRLAVASRPRELSGLVHAFNLVLERLDRAFAGLSQFSANLAHELRTPLNNLHGEAEVTLLQPRSADEYREVLISSLEEYDRLSTMIDGLLFLARAESRETKPEWSLVELGEEARMVCDFYSGIADEKNTILSVDGNASAEADAVLVRRALGNVVTNALRHVRGDGHIVIQVAESDGEATVRVIDNGSGIAEADLPHVINRFYRGSDARADPTGSGLGLAIVKSIMDLHAGTITMESAAGKGTTVSLQFPRFHRG